MQLTRVEKEYGFVEHGGKEYQVELSLIEAPKVGEWIFAHGKLAVGKLPDEEAKQILALIAQTEHVHG